MDTKAALSPVIHTVAIKVLGDPDPDTSWLEQDEFADELESYRRGDFGFVGVRACAQLRFTTAQGGWISGPRVTSPGLWGITDNSGEDYYREVGADELGELREMLEALNVPAAEIDRAFSDADVEYR